MHLDTAYFTENNKKNKKLQFLRAGYCSFAYLHCSWPINSARGTGPTKKKRRRRSQTQTPQTQTKRSFNEELRIKLKKYTQIEINVLLA